MQFGPLEETYAILAKFEVSASEEEQKMLQDLEPAGQEFKDMLKEVEQASGAVAVVAVGGSRRCGLCSLVVHATFRSKPQFFEIELARSISQSPICHV